jgi:hypothetical protein
MSQPALRVGLNLQETEARGNRALLLLDIPKAMVKELHVLVSRAVRFRYLGATEAGEYVTDDVSQVAHR